MSPTSFTWLHIRYKHYSLLYQIKHVTVYHILSASHYTIFIYSHFISNTPILVQPLFFHNKLNCQYIKTGNAQQKKTFPIAQKKNYKIYSDNILPIFPISVAPLNSNFAVKPLLNIMNNSESGNNSKNPGV